MEQLMIHEVESLGAKVHQINWELSKEAFEFEHHEGMVQKNHCYNNMFNIAPYIYNKNAKIAYGYMAVGGSFYVRHAFAVSDNGIIDPTYYLLHKDEPEQEHNAVYFVLKTYDTFDEYIDELTKNKNGDGYDVDMRWTLRGLFRDFYMACFNKLPGIVLVE